MWRIVRTLTLTLLLGCSGAAVKTDGPAARKPADVSLEIGLASEERKEAQLLEVLGDAASGTEFSLKLWSAQAAYVYSAQSSASGTPELLSPRAADPPVQTEGTKKLILPAEGEWFKLDEKPGRERILVLFSRRVMTRTEALQQLTERGDAVCQMTRDPPPPNPKVRERGKDKVEGALGEDGTAVLRWLTSTGTDGMTSPLGLRMSRTRCASC